MFLKKQEIRFILRDPNQTPMKCVPLIFLPPVCFFLKDDDRINILQKKHHLLIYYSFWNNEIQSLEPDMVSWAIKG